MSLWMNANMDPNNESNHEKRGVSSTRWESNMGRLRKIPMEELKEIARKGGLAKSQKKRLSSQLNAIKTGKSTTAIDISTCDDCPSSKNCAYYAQGRACQIELNLRRNVLAKFNAITGRSPEDLLAEMARTYTQLSDEVRKNPTYYNLLQEMYLQMQIYELKYGKLGALRRGINIPIQDASSEVKSLMKKLRGKID